MLRFETPTLRQAVSAPPFQRPRPHIASRWSPPRASKPPPLPSIPSPPPTSPSSSPSPPTRRHDPEERSGGAILGLAGSSSAGARETPEHTGCSAPRPHAAQRPCLRRRLCLLCGMPVLLMMKAPPPVLPRCATRRERTLCMSSFVAVVCLFQDFGREDLSASNGCKKCASEGGVQLGSKSCCNLRRFKSILCSTPVFTPSCATLFCRPPPPSTKLTGRRHRW